ncbi:cytochrome P450 [Acrocarpospora macrocephala]|uniref:cytochrome P450 n=1 Tax=Acrocarpospora macrocephala TaxID=150177 RepID=UPI0014781E09|nr:cytochrome P450 [Acrocarpospora macrocephala]
MLSDPVRFSSSITNPYAPQRYDFILSDPPGHTRVRKALMPEFTTSRVAQLRPSLEARVEALFGEISRKSPPVDLIEHLVRPAVYGMSARLLGLPASDYARFNRWAHLFESKSASADAKHEAGLELFEYISALVAHAKEHPGDNLPTRLMARNPDFTDEETASIVTSLAVAGFNPPKGLIGVGLLALLQRPERLGECLTEQAIPAVVQELIRYLATVPAICRLATTDIQLASHDVQKGDFVYVSLAAAGRDSREFHDMENFDIHRSDLRHLQFGHGIHHCLGKALTETLFEIILTQMSRRFPTIALHQPKASPHYLSQDSNYHSADYIPVCW